MPPKVRRLFKSSRTSSADEKQSEEGSPSARTSSGKHKNQLSPILESESTDMDKRITSSSFREIVSGLDQSSHISRYVDDVDGDPPRINDSRPAPQWLDGPRDSTTLPDIIASTYSDYNEEADYAVKQMLAILETLNPIDDHLDLFEKSLRAIECRLPIEIQIGEDGKPDWKRIRQKLMNDSVAMGPMDAETRGLSANQMAAVFDALPFLFDTVACYEPLHKFQNALSMLVLIAMSGNSVIRRQCISAITVMMERNLLSQEFLRQGVVPGLFFIYQSGVGTFQSNDLRMECVQALCQVVSFDTIRDRRWLFDKFLPRFSQMLKDPTMHVRKSALHIFANLGNMFGQKFTEVFLVPHLITLASDMTWAVRKVACEIFVKVAECASNEVRVDILSPNFVRLLNDPNKWVSFIAYQQLGPFISLFANPEITGLELKDGQVIVREVLPTTLAAADLANTTITSDNGSDEFGVLPPDTWLPELESSDDLDYKLGMLETAAFAPPRDIASTVTKTPKRGERVMDSVLSGINKMFSPFDRSSPKSSVTSKDVEKISATFSSPSKRSTLSLHSAVSLMDKWSKRSNPNNPQRFPIFDSSSSEQKSSEQKTEENGGSGIAAKCSSTDDLTKLGLEDDDDMENLTPKFAEDERERDSDDEDEGDDERGLDKSFVAEDEEDEDTPLSMEIKSSLSTESVSVSRPSLSEEPISNEFSLTYWSSNYAIVAIEDELKPFGSSSAFTNSPTSNNYLESRFDVMKASAPRTRSSSFGSHGSPFSFSPRRKANSTSESPTSSVESSKSDNSIVMLNTEEKEKLGILDIDDLSMSSSSSIHGEAAMTEESDISLASIDHVVFEHVPVDLVESYMRVMGPSVNANSSIATGDASLCAEIFRHCAHNFPAVCYTLGRAAWPRLKLVFRKLALDEQARVRQSISHSIHEIANMLGTEIADEDLLPVFYDLRNDQNADVRNGILLHLYDFVKCLSPEKRDEMILSLPQFFPIGAQPGNQAQNGDWRSRFELISQLSKLCSLYSIQDVNLHMSGIALTLADDRVAEVRREAVMLVSTIVGALVLAEWEEIIQSRDVANGHLDTKSKKEKAQGFLAEQFVDDIVSSFAKTQKWTRRQTFCYICAQILRDKQCDGIQFRYFFATPLQQLVQDKVPNVRLASCDAMSVWRKTLLASRSQEKKSPSPSPAKGHLSPTRRDINLVSDMMVKLANDWDIDAAFTAKKCQGLTDDHQPVDVETRTQRMREREELFFGDVIITDAVGNVVRIAGKEVKQIIRRCPLKAADKILDEIIEKEAPIVQSIEDFENEIADYTEQITIPTPPEMLAVAVRVPAVLETQDNTEEVDMEIDEVEEEVPTTSSAAVPAAVEEEEVDVPMDPTPSEAGNKVESLEETPKNEVDE